MKLTQIAGFITVLLFSSNSLGTWSNSVTIETLYVSDTAKGVFVKFDRMDNPDDCSAGSSWYLIEKSSNTMFQEVYSGLMLAKAQKAVIDVNIVDCTDNGLPNIRHIRF